MRIAVIGLAAALALTGTIAFAQSVPEGPKRQPGCGSSPCGVMTAPTGTSLGNNAGSITAGATSFQNPSGNSLINTSPSGSTLVTGAGAVGR